MSDTDRSALEIVTTIAKEKEMTTKVYNLSTRTGRLVARIKGVDKTPTIIVESKKIEGAVLREEVLATLK